ncbi:unnamed protein product [Alternaria burnsii]|nr:unnamed protein product [Alternaria burnsii]
MATNTHATTKPAKPTPLDWVGRLEVPHTLRKTTLPRSFHLFALPFLRSSTSCSSTSPPPTSCTSHLSHFSQPIVPLPISFNSENLPGREEREEGT